MTFQKALIGNELFGMYLVDYGELNATGFNIHFLPVMISCTTVNIDCRKIQDISIGILGISFTFSVTHPWFKPNH